jgi:FADH2 O2-dependent halogenase
VHSEIAHIDRLVDGCFRSFGKFPLFVSYSMLFFAAATNYERQRLANPDFNGAFLLADDSRFATLVRQTHEELCRLTDHSSMSADWQIFDERLLQSLAPYNHVGLGDRSLRNMYRHTAPS